MTEPIDIFGEADPVKRALIPAIRQLKSAIPDYEVQLQKYTKLRQEARDTLVHCREDLAVLEAELEKREAGAAD